MLSQKNIQIIGNCVGLARDLKDAIRDYQSGALKVIIDSVYTGTQVGAFLERTFNSPDRFGKVVYLYS